MNEIMVKIGKSGRVIIPVKIREIMGLSEGKDLILRLREDMLLEIFTPEQAVKTAQKLVKQYIPLNISLVEELISERRKESSNE